MSDARFRIRFYRTTSGRCQACDYARAMDIAHQAKAKRWFVALSELGPALPSDYGKHLRNGIWELRIAIGHHQHRFLYAFMRDVVVVTNAFLKRSRRVPHEQIEAALKALRDWVARRGWEET